MIRIDEIYNNTFWPWLRDNRAGTRMYVCDPFGRSDPDSVICYGREDIHEYDYIFFFDQEPIHSSIHKPTFDIVYNIYGKDITHGPPGPPAGHRFRGPIREAGWLVTSERDSENVEAICNRYQWKPLYYFFHGWAALDWYRGYNRTFLMKPYEQRLPTRTFIAPNRIIAGERQHRLNMLYWIFKLGMTNNHISCPSVCPVENISIYDAIKALPFDDTQTVFKSAPLPMQYAGETDHPMHSCWLSLFDESADSLLYLVTETVATGRRHHLTEKTFKPIALGMPFVLVSTAGSLEYLRSYGFKTFGDIWDESYDQETDDQLRIEKVARLLKSLDDLSVKEKQALFHKSKLIVEHNWNHFYHGGFEARLWKELQDMLNAIQPRS